jgi:hypothetical protein
MLLRFVLVSAIAAIPSVSMAQDGEKPVCNSQIQGQMWPDAANHDRALISRLVRCGELLICVRGTWHYHWEAASVRLDQLGRGAKLKQTPPTGCEIQPVADNTSAIPVPSSGN